MSQAFVGIDPGKSGCVALLAPNVAIELYDTPTRDVGRGTRRAYDERAMVEIIERLTWRFTLSVAVELQHAMPKQGVSSTFSTGEGYGIWKGILAALKVQWQIVTPQAWKHSLMDGQPKEKSSSCIVARRLFPAAEVYGSKGGAKDGRADALLIAEFVRRKNGLVIVNDNDIPF